MDNFYEQLITTEKNSKYNMAGSAMYILFVMAFLAIFAIAQIIIGVVLVAIGVAIFFLRKNLFVEYEYVFTNGEIDVDKILEMKSRKRAITFNIKDVELLAFENSDEVKDFGNKPSQMLNLVPEDFKGDIYLAMVTGGTERVQVRFAPDDKFLDLCFRYNPRAVKKKRY